MALRTQRLLTVLAAVAASIALWALATLGFGVDIHTPAMGEQGPAPLTGAQVAIASAVASLAGWGLLALLERLTRRARVVWTAVAFAVLALSLGAPLTGEGIAAADRALLTGLHLVVAAVLVPGMGPAAGREPEARGTPTRRGDVPKEVAA